MKHEFNNCELFCFRSLIWSNFTLRGASINLPQPGILLIETGPAYGRPLEASDDGAVCVLSCMFVHRCSVAVQPGCTGGDRASIARTSFLCRCRIGCAAGFDAVKEDEVLCKALVQVAPRLMVVLQGFGLVDLLQWLVLPNPCEPEL